MNFFVCLFGRSSLFRSSFAYGGGIGAIGVSFLSFWGGVCWSESGCCLNFLHTLIQLLLCCTYYVFCRLARTLDLYQDELSR